MGEIRADAVYSWPEFSQRTGLKRAAFQKARQMGLRVSYVGGRLFIVGRSWLEFVESRKDDDGGAIFA